MTDIRREVPFFSNTSDNFHCFQAALRMVLGYFDSEREYTWEELDSITAHTSDYTWPLAGLMYCASLGIDVSTIEPFDYQEFARRGYDYLVELFGKEYADVQNKYSDLPQEMRNAEQFIKEVKVDMRIPTQTDITKALLDDGLAMCNVNARVLQDRDGYTGHFIVVTGITEDGLWIHDPGLPPLQNRFCKWSAFDRAWSYPDEKARNVMTFYRQ